MSVISCIRHFMMAVLLGLAGGLLSTSAMADDAAAHLQKISGVISIQHGDGKVALAYEGVSIHVGDIITTEQDSSALLVFGDKSQVALRPASKFQLKAYHYDEAQPNDDSLIVTLLKGGMRTISGYVGKRGNPNAYRLETLTAAIGVRGTDFTARLCDKDCTQEQAHSRLAQPSPSGLAGRVAELEGVLTDVHADGKRNALEKFSPYFENDELRMGESGYALLVMTDGTRLLLQAGGIVRVKQYHFELNKPQTNSLLVEFVRGTARIVTGLIGKKHPEKVRFATATATIGIRGTAFDLICGRKENEPSPCDNEIFVNMRQGRTSVTTCDHEVEVGAGVTAHVDGPGGMPELLAVTPQFIQNNRNPVPEQLPVNADALFGLGSQEVPSGLYVAVNDGRIVMSQDGRELEIGKGDSGVALADGTPPRSLQATPAFVDQDSVLGVFPFIPGLCGAH